MLRKAKLYIFSNCGIVNTKFFLGVLNKKLVMCGTKSITHLPTFCETITIHTSTMGIVDILSP